MNTLNDVIVAIGRLTELMFRKYSEMAAENARLRVIIDKHPGIGKKIAETEFKAADFKNNEKDGLPG